MDRTWANRVVNLRFGWVVFVAVRCRRTRGRASGHTRSGTREMTNHRHIGQPWQPILHDLNCALYDPIIDEDVADCPANTSSRLAAAAAGENAAAETGETVTDQQPCCRCLSVKESPSSSRRRCDMFPNRRRQRPDDASHAPPTRSTLEQGLQPSLDVRHGAIALCAYRTDASSADAPAL